MSDGGVVTAQVGQFSVTSNSGASAEQIRESLKPQGDKAASEAASQLGRRGADAKKAKAEAEPEAKAEPEKPAIRPIPPKEKAEPEGEKEPEQKAEEAEPEPEPDKDKRGDPRHDPKARMLEATRKEAEAKRALAEERAAREQERRAFEARLEALERQREQPKAPEQQPKREAKAEPDEDPRPSPEAFDTWPEYEDARDQWNRRQWKREAEAEHKKRSEAEAIGNEFKAIARKFGETMKEIASEVPPEIGTLRPVFDLKPEEKPEGGNWIANELFFRPENAPALVRHFAAHPDDLERIKALPGPADVTREIGRILGRLEAATAGPSSKTEPAVSKATPPVRPVTGSPYAAARTEYREGMTLDQYYALQKQ